MTSPFPCPPSRTFPRPASEVRLRIHTHVREDALQLFGFASADEKNLFEKLISVSGVGPTLGIKILSGTATPADLILAIRRGQLDKLVRIPGIGKKTAERLVLELRDKMPAPAGDEPQAGGSAAVAIRRRGRRAFGAVESGIGASGRRNRHSQSQSDGRGGGFRGALPALSGAVAVT